MSVFVTLHPTSNPRAKALAALKRCRVCHDFPLEFALSELVAYVNLHGQERQRAFSPVRRVAVLPFLFTRSPDPPAPALRVGR